MGTMYRHGLLTASDRLYRLLLRAYPKAFRREYGAEMAQVFRDCCRDTYARRGLGGLTRLWRHVLSDLAISAIEEHLNGGMTMLLKRLFDLVFALVALLLLAPVFVVVTVLIKLDSPGPVFYKDLRVGKDGRLFHMYKFRTMVVGAGRMRVPPAGQSDPRITRVGRLLRDSLLDETPQYVNVLKGDMSLIGPRPPRPGEVRLDDTTWQRVLSMRPGMTGLALLTYGPGAGDAQQIRDLDLQYVQRRSMLFDLKLLIQTFAAIVGQSQRSV